MKKWSISGVKILTPDTYIKNGTVLINGDKIDRVEEGVINNPVGIEISDGVIVPGLINAHDHLLGTYYPKVGSGPYVNWLPWDNDLKSSPVYRERQQIENRDLYLLGAYRNLVSGVTTVSDHIPHFVGDPFYDILPVKAIKDFAMAHAVASFALAWGDGIEVEYQKARENDIPFITHIAEGYDDETVNDIKTLDGKGALGEHSVLIHGIAFSEKDMDLIRKRNANTVWCGDSNMYMFNDTTDIRMQLQKGINVSIGTDSPMSGGENLLYEMKFDKMIYKRFYDEELPDSTILKMVTVNPARAFRMRKSGSIKKGNIADLTVFNNREKKPESSVVHAGLRDVMLVVIDGRPVYGNAEYRYLFERLDVEYQSIVLDGTEKLIIGDLIGLLQRISRAVGFKKEFPFLPVEFEV